MWNVGDPRPGGAVEAVVDVAGVVWDAVFDSDEDGRYPNGGWVPRVRRPDGVARLLRWQDLLERHGPVTEYGTAVWEQANLLVAAWIDAAGTGMDRAARESTRAVLGLLVYATTRRHHGGVLDVDPREVLADLGGPGAGGERRIAAVLGDRLAVHAHPTGVRDAWGWTLHGPQDPRVPGTRVLQTIRAGAPGARRVAEAVFTGSPVRLADPVVDGAEGCR